MNTYATDIKTAFAKASVFTRAEAIQYLKRRHKSIKESTVDRLLHDLRKDHTLTNLSRGVYTMKKQSRKSLVYETDISNDAAAITTAVEKRFPAVDFSVWETYALNEFANHQLARNTIFVEVEKMFEEDVFTVLREQFDFPLLLKPTSKEIALYSDVTTAIVITLTTEAPVKEHRPLLEKMLVDLYANSCISVIVSKGDFPGIYESAFSKYLLDEKTMLRYARRRGKAEIIQTMIKRFPSKWIRLDTPR